MVVARCLATMVSLFALRAHAGSKCTTDAHTILQGHDLRSYKIVVTGGDSGIGLATVEALARQNATVLIAAYHIAHGQEVAQNVSKRTGNDNVSAMAIDLSNFSSVRSFANHVLAKFDTVDILINDAGIADPIAGIPGITEDGYERVIETNYLGHFLLTSLLLPVLRTSLRGRVISVSSVAHVTPCALAKRSHNCLSDASNWFIDVTTPTPNVTVSKNFPATNYGISKFMQIAHMTELARREEQNSGVRAYSMHPGLVQTAMSKNKFTNASCVAICLASMGRVVDKCEPGVCPIFPQEAAATLAFLSVAKDADLVNGGYYFECEPAKRHDPFGWSWDRDPELLYNASLNWTGLVGSSSMI